MDALNIGVIGCGYICGEHLKNILACDQMRLRAVGDVRPDAAEATRHKASADYATTDPERILGDRTIDAVLILTSHDTHVGLIEKACQARKPFFVEKPLALTIAETQRIQRCVKDANVPHQVGYWFRHSPLVRRVSDTIPRPYAVIARCCRGGGAGFDAEGLIHRGDIAARSGYLDQAGYLFDVIGRLIPSAPVRVQAVSVSDRPSSTIFANVKFAGGEIASAINSNIGSGGCLKKWYFEILGGEVNAAIHNNTELRFSPEVSPPITDNDYFNGFNEQMPMFARLVREGGRSPVDVWEASIPTVLMEKAVESARTGAAVAVDLNACLTAREEMS